MNSAQQSSERSQQLLQFIGDKGYVCDIGSQQAREQQLTVVELGTDSSNEDRFEKIRRGLRTFLEKQTGGLVIVPSNEPREYEELAEQHADITTDLMTATFLEELELRGDAVEQAASELLATNRNAVIHIFESEQYDTDESAGLQGLAAEQVVAYLLGKDQWKGSSHPETPQHIREAVLQRLDLDPETVPMSSRGGGLFTIALSPVFSDQESKEALRAVARAFYAVENRPHPRFSPVTCLVTNFYSEILRVLDADAGMRIHMKVALSPFKHQPSKSLSGAYERLDGPFDAFVMNMYRIEQLDGNPLPDQERRKLVQGMAQKQKEALEVSQRLRNGEISYEVFETTLTQLLADIDAQFVISEQELTAKSAVSLFAPMVAAFKRFFR